ncbi:MAG: hypothetical protein HQL40_14425 [Alphaproteobacteria bacterium]|nr:hypothetical protein [Alphaproteobacteria bacterium]
MSYGDPLSPFFETLRNMNEFWFRGGANQMGEIYRRNIDAIEKTNRAIVGGMIEASQRQAQVMQKTMADLGQAAQGMAGGADRGAGAEMMRQAIVNAVERMADVNRNMAEGNAEALEMLRGRLIENMGLLTAKKDE